MDRQERREQAGADRRHHDGGDSPGDVLIVDGEQQVAELLAGGRPDVARPGRADHDPAGEAVEDHDRRDGHISGQRHTAGGVAGLLTVEGGRLEAEEALKGEHQAEPDPGRQDGARREGGQRERRTALVPQHPGVEHQQDRQFRDHERRENPGAEVDLPVPQETDSQDGRAGVQLPRQRDVELLLDDKPGEVAEPAHQLDRDRVVGDHRDQGGRDRRRLAQAGRDIGVERAGIGDPLAHRRVADGEAQQDHACGDEGGRCSGACPQDQGERQNPDHRGQRSRRGHHQEHDLRCGQRAAQAAGSCGLSCYRHTLPPFVENALSEVMNRDPGAGGRGGASQERVN